MADQHPRLRRDLEAKTLLVDGVSWVEVLDRRNGERFRFYEFEHAVARLFDGRPLPDLLDEASACAGAAVSIEQLQVFAERLRELGFLDPPPGSGAQHLRSQAQAAAIAAAPAPPTSNSGPSLFASAAPAQRRRSPLLFAALGTCVALGVGAGLFTLSTASEPPPIAVSTVIAAPASVDRWFEATATIERGVGPVLAFPASGRILEGGQTFRAQLKLAREDADLARRLGWCHAQVEAAALDCELAADAGDETHVVVELAPHPAVAAGKTLRLAKARYQGVFLVPATAVVRVGQSDRVYVASADGRAEPRAVALADRSAMEAVVAQGLDDGDAVIVAPPPELSPYARVRISRPGSVSPSAP